MERRKLEALQCEVENIVNRAGLNGHSLSSLQAKKRWLGERNHTRTCGTAVQILIHHTVQLISLSYTHVHVMKHLKQTLSLYCFNSQNKHAS